MRDLNSPDDVGSRDDCVRYIMMLSHQAGTEQIENPTTDRFLEAASSWIHDCDGAYASKGESVPSLRPDAWRFLARILETALHYE